MDIFDKCAEFTLPDEMKKQKLYPYFRTISSGQSPEVTINGQKVVMLGSNNYLGLTENPDVKAAAARALAKYEEMVDRMYEVGKGVNMASQFEIDDVIDPLESRRWIMSALRSAPADFSAKAGRTVRKHSSNSCRSGIQTSFLP